MPSRQYTWDQPELWGSLDRYRLYRFSTWGRILNVYWGRLLTPQAYSEDYPARIKLRRDGQYDTMYVHRLIAETFLSGYRPRLKVEHLDGDYHNSHLLNLHIPQGGVGQFLGGDESVVVRMVEDSNGQLYDSAAQAARCLSCNLSEIHTVLREQRRGIRGVSVEYVWVEGRFDGNQFVPWTTSSIEELGMR